MKPRQLISSALLCLALIGTAGASTRVTNLGALANADFGAVGSSIAASKSFQDIVHFDLPSNSTRILSNAMGELAGGALETGKYTFADLAPARDTAAMFGTAKYSGGSAASYRVSVAAVPEMETWLMLLIGVGLAAYQLHRKQKALGQQVLIDEASSSA